MFNLPADIESLLQFDSTTLGVTTREGKHLEVPSSSLQIPIALHASARSRRDQRSSQAPSAASFGFAQDHSAPPTLQERHKVFYSLSVLIMKRVLAPFHIPWSLLKL